MLNLKYPVVEFAKSISKTPQAIHKYCNETNISVHSEKNRSYLLPQSMRDYLKNFDFIFPSYVISFQACKGGVGKTSLCYNIAIRAAQYGARVLAIDMDMQAHLTLAFQKNENLNFPVWQDILEGKDINNAIIELHPHLHLIPSHLDNSYLDKKILQSNKVIYSSYVEDHLEKIRNKYDLILIDCAPALSNINTAVSLASNKIFIPVTPDIFSFDGVEKTLSELQSIHKAFKKESDVTIILNRFDARERNSLDIIANLKNSYGKLLSQTIVISSAEIKNSLLKREIIFDSKKNHPVCGDLDRITKEILNINI